MLDPIVDALHRLRPPGRSLDETWITITGSAPGNDHRTVVGKHHPAQCGIFGAANSVSAQALWWSRQLELALEIND
ncbi:hypothetical protein [Nocardia cyriacigeorgica]|uniref:Uncharacterized protein n=1 Tax=Nocardia cyriacigeorgica TaxID=135487 RepID=A0A6P1CZJ1_9NOCA|nr:hypothetical protein [Nocardia cyriacigeorgica]NEW37697.1 hypothetical protein [Nocardia cyriacigeorgica]NEW43288.1 hypothetical protein [Nocardia cyriacigeorgica]